MSLKLWLLLLLLLLLLSPLTSTDLEEEEVAVEVIVDRSPCSITCGLGVMSQTLCLLKDGKTAMEEEKSRKNRTEVSHQCRVQMLRCVESWLCGLNTITVTSGQRAELDCLGEVMEVMGRFSWRVSWRYARGIISSDDSLFAHWEAPELGRVILDPVREEDAGTYRCEVQDATFRRVKRVYWGVRVLPEGILNLDYEGSLAQWESEGNQQNQTVPKHSDYRMALIYTVLVSLTLAGVTAGITLLLIHQSVRRSHRGPDSRSV